MKLVDVKSSTYIDFGVENNDRDPKFKVDDHARNLKLGSKLKYLNIDQLLLL